MNFRVAVLQMRAESKNVTGNLHMVLLKMKEAAQNGADILLLPECFLTGYDLPITQEEALTEDSEAVIKICEAAGKYGIGVVVTAFTKGKEKPQNSAFVVSDTGSILMKYSKVHTCDFADEACLESGREFKVCSFKGVKIGIMICYDREYPESARLLMLKGAELILVPNDCGSMEPRLRALSTRAYENMVGVVMANPNGPNAGCSCAYSPICWDDDGIPVDNTILLADDQAEGLFFADFDMDRLRNYRECEMMGNTYRKPAAYGELLTTDIRYPFIRR